MTSLLSRMKKALESHARIYLDYASITPVDKRVAKAMAETSRDFPANPSSLYKEGVEAMKKIEDSRKRIAQVLDAHSEEIILTSGGTESNNLAIRGVLQAWKLAHEGLPRVIASAIEHPSIRELLLNLEKAGECEVTWLAVDETGIIEASDVRKALKPETALVSVMLVNNEIGTIQPVAEVAKVIRSYKKERAGAADGGLVHKAAHGTLLTQYPYLHSDACQAALFCPLRVPPLGIDLMTLDGSKMYGPRGSGILYARRGIRLSSQTLGGDQERGFRAGTENVGTAEGLALALELAQAERMPEGRRMETLRNQMLQDIQKAVPHITINGDMKMRVPNNINICLPGMDAEFAVLRLDARGVCASSVTSCRSKKEDSSSYVMEAMGKPDCAKSSLRITLGRFTTMKESQVATGKIISVLTGMI